MAQKDGQKALAHDASLFQPITRIHGLFKGPFQAHLLVLFILLFCLQGGGWEVVSINLEWSVSIRSEWRLQIPLHVQLMKRELWLMLPTPGLRRCGDYVWVALMNGGITLITKDQSFHNTSSLPSCPRSLLSHSCVQQCAHRVVPSDWRHACIFSVLCQISGND